MYSFLAAADTRCHDNEHIIQTANENLIPTVIQLYIEIAVLQSAICPDIVI